MSSTPPPPPPPAQPAPRPQPSGWKGLPIWLRLAIGVAAFAVLAGTAVLVMVLVTGVGLFGVGAVTTVGQADRALEAEAESATRNAALEIEAAFVPNGRYPDDLDRVLEQSGPWPVDFTVASSSAAEFCIESTHPGLSDRGVIVHYDSDGGGIGDGACP